MKMRSLVSCLALLCALTSGSLSRAQAPAPAATTPSDLPRVTGLMSEETGSNTDIELGRVIRFDVPGIDKWVAANPGRKLVPFIDGRPVIGNYGTWGNDAWHVELMITPESKRLWMTLLGEPRGLRRPVPVSIGPEDGAAFPSVFSEKARSANLVIIPPVYGILSLVVIVATGYALVRLARATGIVRDAPSAPGQPLKPYNLGRVQMAFWFFLTFTSYIVIWLITDAVDTITASILGLIGISATTALSEVMIDAKKDSDSAAKQQDATSAKAALEQGIAAIQAQLAALTTKPALSADEAALQESLNQQLIEKKTQLALATQQLAALAAAETSDESRGFLRDILSDGSGGYNFHRFQIVAWTIVLGGIFIIGVYNSLAMPEFSATLLALMGMSSGTYLGFKFPEQR